MAVTARQVNNSYYSSQTGMYVNGATARALPKPQPNYAPSPVRRVQPGYRVKPQPKSRLSFLQKLLVITCILTAAAALLFLLVRYERISDEYAVVNSLKNDIEEKKRELDTLSVTLECSVSLEEAKEAARRAGMNYPTVEQIVKLDADPR